MHTYIHKVHYYETDKMGIAHHSNYIRWMEEARADFLEKAGYGLQKLEAEGVTSPVVAVECHYRRPTTFGDEVQIDVTLEEYTGVKLVIGYRMAHLASGAEVLTARSTHCFVDAAGRPIAVRKHFPAFDAALKKELPARARG